MHSFLACAGFTFETAKPSICSQGSMEPASPAEKHLAVMRSMLFKSPWTHQSILALHYARILLVHQSYITKHATSPCFSRFTVTDCVADSWPKHCASNEDTVGSLAVASGAKALSQRKMHLTANPKWGEGRKDASWTGTMMLHCPAWPRHQESSMNLVGETKLLRRKQGDHC
jgi:hypothetical protein